MKEEVSGMNPDELNETERIVTELIKEKRELRVDNFMKKYGLKSSYYVAEFLRCSRWDIEMATLIYEDELGRYMDREFASTEDFSLDKHLVELVLELKKFQNEDIIKKQDSRIQELSKAIKQKPNDRCACGSKKKFKKCCRLKRRTEGR